LMTVEDLAAYLHKPVNTICKMRAEGTGPPGYRVGMAGGTASLPVPGVSCVIAVGTHVIPQGFDQVIPQVLAVFLF